MPVSLHDSIGFSNTIRIDPFAVGESEVIETEHDHATVPEREHVERRRTGIGSLRSAKHHVGQLALPEARALSRLERDDRVRERIPGRRARVLGRRTRDEQEHEHHFAAIGDHGNPLHPEPVLLRSELSAAGQSSAAVSDFASYAV